MTNLLESVNKTVWGAPTLILILSIGLLLTVRAGFPQLRLFLPAVRTFFKQCKPSGRPDGTSSYKALCTALAATVGTGNIAGVAGAISIGGAGAVFWMWVSALLGMATKYAEATLAVHYREKNNRGEWIGGPMYMICKGLKRSWQPLAYLYCFFGVVAALGVGNATQVNAVIHGLHSAADAVGIGLFHGFDFLIGVCLAVVVLLVLFGGASRIGDAAQALVPFASICYILLAIGVFIVCRQNIPQAFRMIFTGAFSPKAVTGGAVGTAFIALRIGSSRGVFSNEAGMGTASIAHAGANVSHPCQQGLMGIMEVFLDTIVICTVTALVILCSNISVPYGLDSGASLTISAFCAVYGKWVSIPLAVCLCCFAVATIFGWGLYGLRCAQFLFGEHISNVFSLLQSFTVILGAILGTGTVWLLSETVNGLMAIPNLIALAFLSPELSRLTLEYKKRAECLPAYGGTYENFNQCKSMRAFSDAKVSPLGGGSRKGR